MSGLPPESPGRPTTRAELEEVSFHFWFLTFCILSIILVFWILSIIFVFFFFICRSIQRDGKYEQQLMRQSQICQIFRHCFAPATFFPNTNIKQLKWIPPLRWKLVVKWTQLEPVKKLRCTLKKLKLKLNECSRGARAARAPELNNRSQKSSFQWTKSLGSTRPSLCWVEPSLQVLECVFKRVFFMKY